MSIKRSYIYILGELEPPDYKSFVILSYRQTPEECLFDLNRILQEPRLGLFVRVFDPYTAEILYSISSMMNGSFVEEIIKKLEHFKTTQSPSLSS